MNVDAEVWYWGRHGMVQGHRLPGSPTGYITVRDAERLLEEADVRRLNQERERRDEEIERRRDTGDP